MDYLYERLTVKAEAASLSWKLFYSTPFELLRFVYQTHDIYVYIHRLKITYNTAYMIPARREYFKLLQSGNSHLSNYLLYR